MVVKNKTKIITSQKVLGFATIWQTLNRSEPVCHIWLCSSHSYQGATGGGGGGSQWGKGEERQGNKL